MLSELYLVLNYFSLLEGKPCLMDIVSCALTVTLTSLQINFRIVSLSQLFSSHLSCIIRLAYTLEHCRVWKSFCDPNAHILQIKIVLIMPKVLVCKRQKSCHSKITLGAGSMKGTVSSPSEC